MDYDHGYIAKLDLSKENIHGKKMAHGSGGIP